MTPDLEALARRAVACRGWRWMPGMKLLHSGRIVHVIGQRVEATEHPWLGSNFAARNPLSGPFADAPDLTDPATLGCLLALVREAWPDVVLCYDFGDERYNGLEHYTNEEAPRTFLVLRSPESLVAALENAP